MDASASKLRIAKRAAIEMGVKIPSSFSEPQVGTTIAEIYDDCRQELLEDGMFSFSTETIALATLAQVPIDFGDGASIAYSVPDRYLRIDKLNFPSALVKQQLLNGQNVIISDTAGLIIKACLDNDDPTTYSAKARLALALKIASSAYFKLVEGGTKGQELIARYDKALLSAIADDSQGSTPDQMSADNILFERMAGAGAEVASPGDDLVRFFD